MPRWAAYLGLFVLVGCGRSGVFVFADETSRCGAPSVYAAEVLAYDPSAEGGAPPTRWDVADPVRALGAPDYHPGAVPMGTVSIGEGGVLELGLGDCAAFTAEGIDLRVYEYGVPDYFELGLRPTRDSEDALLEAGVDLDDGFVPVGVVTDSLGGVDVDTHLPGLDIAFDAIRVHDVAGQGLVTSTTPGADIDAVEVFFTENEAQ